MQVRRFVLQLSDARPDTVLVGAGTRAVAALFDDDAPRIIGVDEIEDSITARLAASAAETLGEESRAKQRLPQGFAHPLLVEPPPEHRVLSRHASPEDIARYAAYLRGIEGSGLLVIAPLVLMRSLSQEIVPGSHEAELVRHGFVVLAGG